MNGLCCDYQSEEVRNQKMKKKQGEKQLVIVFVRVNKIVENESKKYNNHARNRCGKSLAKFDEPRSAENIFVEPGYVINCDPKDWNKNQSKVKPTVKFNRNVDSKSLRFNNCFAVYKEYNPTDGGS